MKQVHNVRIRVIDPDKELVTRLVQQIISDSGVKIEDITLKIMDDGEESLTIGEIWADKQQPVRKFLRLLQEKIPPEQKEKIAKHPDKFLDITTHCFLRLEKNALQNNEYVLTQKADSVNVRLNIAAFPATREKALPIVEELFKETK
jgi:RNA-binding protein